MGLGDDLSVPLSSEQFVRGRSTKRVRLEQLEPSQVYVNADKVARMATKAGRDLPPVLISGNDRLHDGHHRYSAAHLRGRKTVDAVRY